MNKEENNQFETFQRLRQTPISEMIELYPVWRQQHEQDETYNTMLNIEFARQHHWSWEDYLRAKHQYVMQRQRLVEIK